MIVPGVTRVFQEILSGFRKVKDVPKGFKRFQKSGLPEMFLGFMAEVLGFMERSIKV